MSRRNEPAARAAWPMHGATADFAGTPTSKLGKGTASPPYHFRCRTITVAYFGSGDSAVDRWTVAAYDREPLSRREIGAVIERARSAKWRNTKAVRGHFRRHKAPLGIGNQAAFRASATDLIRRGDRDVYLSVRKGALNATFVQPAINQKTGKRGYRVTSVDLAENKITSHHWREKLETTADEVPALKQPGRGIMKWLFG